MPRLVMVDDYRLESYIDGNLLIFTHQDVPGIIGKVGTAFGKHGINIAQMAVGRAGDTPGGHAIGVLNLDSQPSQAAIDDMLAIEAVEKVRTMDLPPAGKMPAWLA
ncbi:MAG: ACT domain-containing protein, partial [Planctomycetales bacterium]|nr:ACT domain-containing protein [Planctomycetales bacterium]